LRETAGRAAIIIRGRKAPEQGVKQNPTSQSATRPEARAVAETIAATPYISGVGAPERRSRGNKGEARDAD